jgi:D-tyrosyl-tRNA(Tyr) deacylase
MNRSVAEIGRGVLAVSQYTHYGDTTRGNLPSFVGAAPPGEAEARYRAFSEHERALGVPCAEGVFRADMVVELVNDGPVTLLLVVGPGGAAGERDA